MCTHTHTHTAVSIFTLPECKLVDNPGQKSAASLQTDDISDRGMVQQTHTHTLYKNVCCYYSFLSWQLSTTEKLPLLASTHFTFPLLRSRLPQRKLCSVPLQKMAKTSLSGTSPTQLVCRFAPQQKWTCLYIYTHDKKQSHIIIFLVLPFFFFLLL